MRGTMMKISSLIADWIQVTLAPVSPSFLALLSLSLREERERGCVAAGEAADRLSRCWRMDGWRGDCCRSRHESVK